MPAPKDSFKYAEYIKKIGDASRGKKQSPEWIKKRVESRKLKNNFKNKFKGKKRPKFSEEWCKNISVGNKGRIPWNKGIKTGPLSNQHRISIGKSNSKPKPPFTQEHKDNIKKARALQIMPQCSEEKRLKIRLARAKQILPMKDSKPERMMQLALMLHGIKFEKHKMIKDGIGFFHQVDIFIEPNICIEVDGDYWHANPQKYTPNFIIKTRNGKTISASDIWSHDLYVNHKLNLLGYNVIRIWESDINDEQQTQVMNIFKLIKLERV